MKHPVSYFRIDLIGSPIRMSRLQVSRNQRAGRLVGLVRQTKALNGRLSAQDGEHPLVGKFQP
jgi:hypothetical protein